jgi:exonuclease SbcD
LKSFSFIHAADLHLGSPFKGIGSGSPATAEQLRSTTFDAFSGLIDLCLEKSVDFLLISGDIFDLSGRSLRAQLTFRDGLSRLSENGIRSFVVFGNHDPWETWSSRISWPEGAHVFLPDQVETIIVSVNETPVAAVSGISYRNQRETRNLASLFKAEQPNLFQIALLHSNCGNNPDHGAYAPCSVHALRKSGFDYWALGHVHEKKILDTSPYIVYPGCIQGLSIRETGMHGCWLVSVTADKQASLAFHHIDRLRWQTADISIANIGSLDELDRNIASTLDQIRESAEQRPAICRIRLTGRGSLYSLLRKPEIAEELSDRTRQLGEQLLLPVWVQRLDIQCEPDVDLSQRRERNDLLGEILSNVSGIRNNPETLTDRLMPVLKDIYGNPKLRRHLNAPNVKDLDNLLQEAAMRCYDLLELEE